MALKELWSWIKTIALAVILALLIREYVLAFYVVDGNSMQPTLQDGQMIAVNKITYRFGAIKRGDVAVFSTRKATLGLSKEKVLIKRIIALPGDTIQIKDGKVFLNGKELIEDYVDAEIDKDMELLLLGEDSVFVLGDNRHAGGSLDSREFGPIPLDSILGKAKLVIFPNPHKVK